MAAPSTLINARDFLLKVGNNAVGCETSSRLVLSRPSRGQGGKCSPQWIKTAAGAADWRLEFDSLYLEGGNALAGGTLAATVSGVGLEGLRSVGIEFAAETFEALNSTTYPNRVREVASRSVRLALAGDFYDPAGANGAALALLLDEVRGATTSGPGFTVAVSVGQLSVTGPFRPTEATVEAALGGFTGAPLTLESAGDLTLVTTGADTGLAALLGAAFNAAGVQALTADFETALSEATYWTGQTLPERLSVAVPLDGEVTVSGTLAGTGALTEAQNAVAP